MFFVRVICVLNVLYFMFAYYVDALNTFIGGILLDYHVLTPSAPNHETLLAYVFSDKVICIFQILLGNDGKFNF